MEFSAISFLSHFWPNVDEKYRVAAAPLVNIFAENCFKWLTSFVDCNTISKRFTPTNTTAILLTHPHQQRYYIPKSFGETFLLHWNQSILSSLRTIFFGKIVEPTEVLQDCFRHSDISSSQEGSGFLVVFLFTFWSFAALPSFGSHQILPNQQKVPSTTVFGIEIKKLDRKEIVIHLLHNRNKPGSFNRRLKWKNDVNVNYK